MTAVNSPARRARIGFIIAVAAVISICSWAAFGSNRGNFTHPAPAEFYDQLSDAFLAGQVHLKVAPHPGLKNLADPYLDAPWVPRLHDATYFHDRYYLYFGPGAALALVMPWRLLCGTFLSDGATTALLVAAGFLFGCKLLWKIWWRWFASLPGIWLATAVLLWGLGNYIFLLIDGATVYSVPIVFASVACLAALGAIWESIVAPPERAGGVAWFALGSFLWAGALSGRPNYLFSLPALAVPFWHLREQRDAKKRRSPAHAFHLFLAGALPVAAVGLALAGYNWVRYRSVTEFGVHYQFAMSDQRATKLFELKNFWPGLQTYLFSFPDLSPYFPFTSNIEYGYSLMRCAPVTVLALFFPLSFASQSFRTDRVWRTLGLTLLAGFFLNFISLLGVPWANERYFGDFTPLSILLACAAGWFLLRITAKSSRAVRSTVRAAITALAVWTLAFAAIFLVARFPARAMLAATARTFLGWTDRMERLRHIEHGPLHLRIVFGEAPPATVEPLVVSGHGRDLLFVKYLERDRVQFGFFHAGNPAVFGEPVEIIRGKSSLLDVDLGALYPPPEHPRLAGWSDVQIELLKSTVAVQLDHREVLRTHSVFYPTHPDDVLVGSNPKGLMTAKKFSGTLTRNAPRAMPTPADLAIPREEGALRLTLMLPPFSAFRSEPLVSTGRRGAGDVVYVSYLGKNQIRFGHDSVNHGAVETETVPCDFTRPHQVEIDLGSLRSSTGPLAAEAPLVIRFDGRTLLDEPRPFNPSSANQVVFGFNGMGSSVVAEAFGGHILNVETLGRLPARPPLDEGYGAVRLAVSFPRGAVGRSEPLLVTGRTGKGDVVFVTYLNDSHIQIGIDHWGVGGCKSAPITLDLEQSHSLELFIGSLFPAETSPWWNSVPIAERNRLHARAIVKLDGVTVLDQPQLAHPSEPSQIVAGRNAIGASSCGESFSGKILAASREPPAAP